MEQFDDLSGECKIARGMSSKYDLVVIGSGPGGYVSAIRAAQLGMKTAVIERDNPGGVCLNWGCIPSKAIIKCAEIYGYFKNSEQYGISHKGLSVDYSKVIDKSRGASSALNKGVEFLLKKNKIDLIKGSAKLLRPGAVGIAGDEDSEIQAQKILLATGSVPQTIPGLKIDGEIVMTSDEAIMSRRIPKTIVIIGGGYIGVEFAYVYNMFGGKVTIVERDPNIIPGADADVSAELEKNFKKSGMEVLTSTEYKSIKKTKNRRKGDRCGRRFGRGKSFERGNRSGRGRQESRCELGSHLFQFLRFGRQHGA